jgi:hypothetical protein
MRPVAVRSVPLEPFNPRPLVSCDPPWSATGAAGGAWKASDRCSGRADAAGLGTIEIKAMRDHGYSAEFAVGVTAASATLGPIIPPSLPFVIYAMFANVSIGALFLAGILPGVVMALLMMTARCGRPCLSGSSSAARICSASDVPERGLPPR